MTGVQTCALPICSITPIEPIKATLVVCLKDPKKRIEKKKKYQKTRGLLLFNFFSLFYSSFFFSPFFWLLSSNIPAHCCSVCLLGFPQAFLVLFLFLFAIHSAELVALLRSDVFPLNPSPSESAFVLRARCCCVSFLLNSRGIHLHSAKTEGACTSA